MRRRVLGALAAATWLLASTARGQTPPAARFRPESFSPGEAVEAVLPLPLLAEAQPFVLERGRGLPDCEDPELRRLELARGPGGWELRLRFVPWSPGPGRVPPISVGGQSFPALAYQAASGLGAGDLDLSPPRPQRDPPGAALYLYGFAGAALFLGLGLAAALAYLVPAARAALERRRAALAYRRLRESLDYLAAGAASSEPASFYAALSRAFRLYLEQRVEPTAPALTASELAALPSSTFPAPGLRDEAACLLSEAERVRYAGERPGPAALVAAARRAGELAEAAEDAIDARL